MTFLELKTFLDAHEEGVRVEYKREIVHVPKSVSAMANTLGGTIFYGVEADQQGRVTGIPGIPAQTGLKDRITDACYKGVYPPVTPDIELVDLQEGNRVVVVVQISESLDAPHAVDGGRKVYERTGAQSQPIDFMEVDRIEFLLKRRERPQRRREEIQEQMRSRIVRSASFCGLEFNEFAFFLHAEPLQRKPARSGGNSRQYLFFPAFIYITGDALRLASQYLEQLSFDGGIGARVDVMGVKSEWLLIREGSMRNENQSIVASASGEWIGYRRDMEIKLPEIVMALVEPLAWAFDVSYDGMDKFVEEILRVNNLWK